MGRSACTEPQFLHNGALYLYLFLVVVVVVYAHKELRTSEYHESLEASSWSVGSFYFEKRRKRSNTEMNVLITESD
jgi:hypothetical protein